MSRTCSVISLWMEVKGPGDSITLSQYFPTVLSLKSKPLTVTVKVRGLDIPHLPPGFILLHCVLDLRRVTPKDVLWLLGGTGQWMSQAGDWGKGGEQGWVLTSLVVSPWATAVRTAP